MTTPPRDEIVVTASQTVGPFFDIGFAHLRRDHIILPIAREFAITIRGRVLDGNAAPIPDAVLELWQADAGGTYDHRGAQGFGRVFSSHDGTFAFTTVRPGPVRGPDSHIQAPHVVVTLFMRGLLRQLVTRLYFPEDSRNDIDPVLSMVPPHRRGTLIARASHAEPNTFLWDIVVQGAEETVFFELD